ncbi:glyoxalase/bleomycin resistance/dioxygenase family protein [Streptomyces sp. FXJ1.172]|uniref:VOC family protein n=1 Tax=Streptomyces sp. FXJ1.172 TaxID=710705 RepID=UPI0007CF96BE|nr:glyoxalase/bleomycin resistance/dioxygenase family protein [Streptomyces sp. FXJ1.172]WEO99052.1 glyoxalase/bleomycin resistance/dioxygenase family protein [Streptomyces sp. FXJ1.172]
MKALTTLARLYVDDLDEALPALRELTGEDVRTRFSHGAVDVASIGGFLLVAGSEQALAPFRRVQSTVLVDDLDGLHTFVTAHGGEILDGPREVPTGRNATVRHPGGVVLEYVEHRA